MPFQGHAARGVPSAPLSFLCTLAISRVAPPKPPVKSRHPSQPYPDLSSLLTLGDSSPWVQWFPPSRFTHQAGLAPGPCACLLPQRVLSQETLWRDKGSAKLGGTQEDGMNGGLQVVRFDPAQSRRPRPSPSRWKEVMRNPNVVGSMLAERGTSANLRGGNIFFSHV